MHCNADDTGENSWNVWEIEIFDRNFVLKQILIFVSFQFWTEWTFYAEFSYDTGEKLGKFERFLFFNEFFRFCFLLFEVNLEFIWFSLLVLVSMHLLCEIFLRNVKILFRKNVPKFLNFVGTRSFEFLSKFKIAFVLNFFCFGFNALQCLRYWRKFLKYLWSWNFRKKNSFWNRNLNYFFNFKFRAF